MFYKMVENPDKDICDAFEEELRKSPQKIFDQMKNYGPGKGMEDSLKQLKNASENKQEAAPEKKKEEKKVVHDEL